MNVNEKKKKIIYSNNIYISKSKENFVGEYINKIESKLFNLGFPYKLNAKRYLIIKYFYSLILFFIAFLNYKSFKIGFVFYLISFFTPNYLIYSFKKKEKYLLINEIKNLTSSIILNLSACATLERALSLSFKVLEYKRFSDAYEKFIYEYKISGYNLKQASLNFENKFPSYELSLFLGTLLQGSMEGNLLENMEKLSDTLELNYFKYLKKKNQERLLYVTLGTIISLLNIILIVMYPIFIQVIDNLQLIFS